MTTSKITLNADRFLQWLVKAKQRQRFCPRLCSKLETSAGFTYALWYVYIVYYVENRQRRTH